MGPLFAESASVDVPCEGIWVPPLIKPQNCANFSDAETTCQEISQFRDYGGNVPDLVHFSPKNESVLRLSSTAWKSIPRDYLDSFTNAFS
jgi:hypothetical protein